MVLQRTCTRVQTILTRNFSNILKKKTLTATISCRECQRPFNIFSVSVQVRWRSPQKVSLFSKLLYCTSSQVPPDAPDQSKTEEVVEPKRPKDKVVKVTTKKSFDYTKTDNIYIEPHRASQEYLLTQSDLDTLPKYSRRSPYAGGSNKLDMLKKLEVESLAIKKYGSLEGIEKEKKSIAIKKKIGFRKFILPEIEEKFQIIDAKPITLLEDNYPRKDEPQAGLLKGSNSVVLWAIFVNFFNFIVKTVAWLSTGSCSMFAEMLHSLADTINQTILLYGLVQSQRKPDSEHPYGYTNLRHISSLLSAAGIFFLGGGVSIYHGIQAIVNASQVEPIIWTVFVLLGSFISEGACLYAAINQVRFFSEKYAVSPWQYVKRGIDPNVTVVLLEDSAAVLGVVIAAACMSLTHYTGNPLYDAVGSIAIGSLLGLVALFIIRTNTQILIGRSIPEEMQKNISSLLENDRMIRSLHDIKATEVGGEARYKAELDFDGREIARAYLYKQDMDQLLKEMQELKDTIEAEEFMLKHGEKMVDSLGEQVDRIETILKSKYPNIRHVDLEVL